ncbi:hypothetical protein RIR_jg16344.t1 [Rhizophagus irregularis DAOM 181602=DAOM 197198]|nr:hypothetical protein RIR_jg16344.t1 [Rhizophagus irregularis DAOM 181602=DAOM 197198]
MIKSVRIIVFLNVFTPGVAQNVGRIPLKKNLSPESKSLTTILKKLMPMYQTIRHNRNVTLSRNNIPKWFHFERVN